MEKRKRLRGRRILRRLARMTSRGEGKGLMVVVMVELRLGYPTSFSIGVSKAAASGGMEFGSGGLNYPRHFDSSFCRLMTQN
jgi:hypothetical protein